MLSGTLSVSNDLGPNCLKGYQQTTKVESPVFTVSHSLNMHVKPSSKTSKWSPQYCIGLCSLSLLWVCQFVCVGSLVNNFSVVTIWASS